MVYILYVVTSKKNSQDRHAHPERVQKDHSCPAEFQQTFTEPTVFLLKCENMQYTMGKWTT